MMQIQYNTADADVCAKRSLCIAKSDMAMAIVATAATLVIAVALPLVPSALPGAKGCRIRLV